MSPHQIPHTEIIESLVVREVGNSPLQDTLRGGIPAAATTGVVPRTGRTPPDLGIGVGTTGVGDMKRIPRRDRRVVVLIVPGIAGRTGGHLSSCW